MVFWQEISPDMRWPASSAIMSYKVTPDGCSHVNILFVGSANLASDGVNRGRSRDDLGIWFEDLVAVGFFGFVVARLGECGFSNTAETVQL